MRCASFCPIRMATARCAPVRGSGRGRTLVATALLLFVAVAGVVSYIAWQGSASFGKVRNAQFTGPARTTIAI